MSGIGAGAFVEGLQGGIASRDAMDRNKQFKQMRKLGITEKKYELADKRGIAEADLMMQAKEGGYDFDQAGFDEEWAAFQDDKDPALLRFGKWMGGKMSGMFGGKGEEGGSEAQMAIATPKVEAPTPVERFGAYADGGIVPHGRYANGGVVDDPTAPRPYSDPRRRREETESVLSDLARATKENAFDDTVNVWRGADDAMSERSQAISDAEGPRETMDAVRGWMGEGIRGTAALGAGLVKDVVIDNPVVQGAMGFMGFDGEGSEAPAADQGIPTTDVPSTPEGDAIGASVDEPENKPEEVAQQAVRSAEEEFIKNPNYTLLVDQGVRPEDLPSMTTQDWSDYRRKITMHAMRQGSTPAEAHQMVDNRVTQMQMAGFNRQAMIANKYLQSGQAREASMALRQAYQYFPNGVSVKFGNTVDPKTGQSVIITMGVDEETGEATGTPMIIDVNRLNAMVENASDPSAFRSWTKDGHDLQMEINKLQSIDDYRQGTLDIGAYRAETGRIGELTGGGRGAMTDAEVRQRSELYMKVVNEAGLMEGIEGLDEGINARALYDAMAQYERVSGIREPATVARRVLEAYQLNPDTGVQELLANARDQ